MTACVPVPSRDHIRGNIGARALPNRRNIAGNLTIIATEGTKRSSIE
jgi:hypothetical protein